MKSLTASAATSFHKNNFAVRAVEKFFVSGDAAQACASAIEVQLFPSYAAWHRSRGLCLLECQMRDNRHPDGRRFWLSVQTLC